jgi:hypothetical protein
VIGTPLSLNVPLGGKVTIRILFNASPFGSVNLEVKSDAVNVTG